MLNQCKNFKCFTQSFGAHVDAWYHHQDVQSPSSSTNPNTISLPTSFAVVNHSHWANYLWRRFSDSKPTFGVKSGFDARLSNATTRKANRLGRRILVWFLIWIRRAVLQCCSDVLVPPMGGCEERKRRQNGAPVQNCYNTAAAPVGGVKRKLRSG